MTGTNPADARERNDCLYRVLVSRIFEPLALYYVESDDSGTPADVRYLDVNPAYERIMGVRREDMIGKTFFEAWSAKESEWRDIIIRSSMSEYAHLALIERSLNPLAKARGTGTN